MREHTAERPRMSGRWHPWLKRISRAVAHLSAASLLASGMASSLAARKRSHRHEDRGGREKADRDRHDNNDRNREDQQANDAKEERRLERANKEESQGDGDTVQAHRSGRHDRPVDASSETESVARRQDATVTPTPTPTEEGGGGGGGGGGDGGMRAGNAGSGLFDSPLATKTRRRANDFENANRDPDEGRTFVDVSPDGESIYETGAVSLITGPDGLEIDTGNITYIADPTPTPEPLPRLVLPEREPGFPFGEDFPFGNAAVFVGPRAAEPSGPNDTTTTTNSGAAFFPTHPEPSSDGGDNTMDYTS